MTDVVISKVVNQVSFKVDNKSWKDAQNKIKRLAGLWHKSSNQFGKAMEQGRRAASMQTKATTQQTRAELKAYRNRKNTLKADNIRFQEQIKNNIDFRKQLQKTNFDFLKGNISTKERSAQVGKLIKQYRSLNQQASRYNQSSKALGAINRVRQGVGSVTRLGVAAGAAAVVGGGAIAHNQYNKVKGEGQQYEQLTIGLMNTFQDRAKEVSDIIAGMANANGTGLIELGNNLVEFVSLMRPLGIGVDDAIKKFQQTSDAMQSYGISGERAVGFQTQLTQALDQGTLDSFKESFAWAPQLRADLLAYVEKEMKIKPKDFMGGLTNGKYSLRDTWFAFLNANASKYGGMSSKFKQSSMAQDARSSNALSLSIYRVFESSGFKDAMSFANKIIISWANTLENNSDKIGQVFGNLSKIASELGDGAFKSLSNWLSNLTAEDIRTYFKDAKTSISEFLLAIKSLAQFINSVLPNTFTQNKQSTNVSDSDRNKYDADKYGKSFVQKERELLNSGLDPQIAAREAEQFALRQSLKIPQPTFKVPSIEDNFVSSRVIRNESSPSNFSGKLDLKINAEVNKTGFSDFVDYKIDNNNMQQINLISY
ncbi:MAG: hypothetical protein ACRC7D_14990 [Aeromonas popoffii]|uniref:hypothetical protein n=1 Tax=Aeromonas popoffii TaxID=70856 RepID=UPI003F37F6D0